MDDSQLLLSKCKNMQKAINGGRPCVFSDFLSFEEQRVYIDFFKANHTEFALYGGYDDSDRSMICAYFDFCPEFPIATLFFEIPLKTNFEHRDVLGALMSLGIKRELVGDIIFFEDLCIFFTVERIAQFVIQNFTSVKKSHISVGFYNKKIEYVRAYDEMIVMASSMRLDCIVCELTNFSRTASSEYVSAGLVFVNGSECLKKDKLLQTDDVLTIRKKGKFRIGEQIGKTKKDRIRLKILKYV